MHIIPVSIDDKSYEIMLSGKRVEGTVGIDLSIMLGNLNAFNRKSRQPGYVRPKDLRMYDTASGWLKKSTKKFKIFVSANCGMGRKRAASELLNQAIELTDTLRSMKSNEELLDEV